MVFHWSLSDSKSPQVSRTLLSILAVLNNAVVWMVSTRPPTSKSSSPFSNPLVTVQNAPITIGIIVTCMFHSFFNSLARWRYLSFFPHSFIFILWSAGTAISTILQVLFFSGLLTEIRLSVCMSILFVRFSCQVMLFDWILSESKSLLVPKTLRSIFTDNNIYMVCMVSILPLISSSSSFLSEPLGTISKPTNFNWYYHLVP